MRITSIWSALLIGIIAPVGTDAFQDAANRNGDPMVIARAKLSEAEDAIDRGDKLMHALHLIGEAERLVFPAGPYDVKRDVLELLARVMYDLGRHDASLTHFEALARLARQNHDDLYDVYARSSALLARRKQMEELPEPDRLPEFVAQARDILHVTERLNHPLLLTRAHRSLGDLLGSAAATRVEAEPHYRTSLEIARRIKDPEEIAKSVWALGRFIFMFGTDLEQATRLINEARVTAVESNSSTTLAYTWREHMRLAWKAQPRELAIAESMRALSAIERLTSSQSHGLLRADVLSAWTPDYYWLTGHVLRMPSPTRDDISTAFAIVERMRARRLLDSLLASEASGASARPVQSAQHQALLDAITQLQNRLLDPRVHDRDRTAIIAELEAREREEEAERSLLAERTAAGRPSTEPVSIGAVEHALRNDEALLSFVTGVEQSFAGDFVGGSWLLVSTTSGTRVIRLPDRTRLHGMVSVFRGFAEDPGHLDPLPGVTLHDVLLKEALAGLPSGIRRLILVPDGPLHHLPFGALRASLTAPPLAMTHELSVAPSASVWLHLRRQPEPPNPGASLVLADPGINRFAMAPAAVAERGWSLDTIPTRTLPYARTEGRAVVAHMAFGSRLLEGAGATESALRAADLRAFGLLHFAAHALVDEGHPDRSAVVLSGSLNDDGLLQAREIAGLRLPGYVVVISACRSATGSVLAGEGVLGLSRSFFQAGARTVIGTLWPIRDDHAATFFEFFYESLGQGQTIGAAMRNARTQAIKKGVPASIWSSVVVIGNDDSAFVRVSEQRRRPVVGAVAVSVLALIAVAAIAALAKLRRK